MTTTPAMPELPEPEAYIFQHEETGNTMFVDRQQVEWGFEKNNPRLQKVGKAYTADQMRAYALATLQAQPAAPKVAIVGDSVTGPGGYVCAEGRSLTPAEIAQAMGEQPAAEVSDADVWALWLRVCDESYNLSTRVMIAKYARAILALRPQSESDVRNTPFGKEAEKLADDYMSLMSECAVLRDRLASLRPQAVPMTDEQATYKQAEGSKNCMQCAAAYMLGLPLAEVPDFEQAGPQAWESFYEFFEGHGFTAEMFPPSVEIEGDYLASGDTERGTSHMVVMRGGKLLHDPHPSNAGLKSVQVVWLIARRSVCITAPAGGEVDRG